MVKPKMSDTEEKNIDTNEQETHSLPTLLSTRQLSILTGVAREIIGRRLATLDHKEGKSRAKLYNPARALELIYLGDQSESRHVSQSEATRQLTVARKAQIDLEMEVTAKKRIPLDVAETVNDRVHSNVAGIIKANRDKVLTEEVIHDILTELRRVPESLSEWTKSV